jgi:hypothetical protein
LKIRYVQREVPMELLLGSHVREHGHRVGQLAGFELELAGLKIRRIIFSPDGELGPQAMTRPLANIDLTHDDGEIELRPEVAVAPLPAVPDVVLLSRAVRLRRGGREIGRFVGVNLNPADRSLKEVFGRSHWWSRRFSLQGPGLDCSTPGEIRSGSSGGTQAA